MFLSPTYLTEFLFPLYNKLKFGGIAQLGERLNGIQKVSGSIPLISTIYNMKSMRRIHLHGFFIASVCGKALQIRKSSYLCTKIILDHFCFHSFSISRRITLSVSFIPYRATAVMVFTVSLMFFLTMPSPGRNVYPSLAWR